MAADPLDEVLRLVAEGRLTAEEAAPVLAALVDALSLSGARVIAFDVLFPRAREMAVWR